MRKAILSTFILLISLTASLEAGINHWTPIGPFGGEINALAATARRADSRSTCATSRVSSRSAGTRSTVRI